jgi:hypothetical protein
VKRREGERRADQHYADISVRMPRVWVLIQSNGFIGLGGVHDNGATEVGALVVAGEKGANTVSV